MHIKNINDNKTTTYNKFKTTTYNKLNTTQKTQQDSQCITNPSLITKDEFQYLVNKINQIPFNHNGKTLQKIPQSPYIRKNYIYERILLTTELESKSSGKEKVAYSDLLSKLKVIQTYNENKLDAKIEKTKQEIQAIKDGTLKIEDWQASEHHYKTPEYKLKVLLSVKNARNIENSQDTSNLNNDLSPHFLSKNNFSDENSIEIVDNKVVIKNPEYKINQTLNLTYDQFNLLFPQNSDYKKVMQTNIPDCYFVSSLQTILNNPESYSKYLTIFSSDTSGNIFITIPSTKLKIKFPKDTNNQPTLFNAAQEQNINLKGALGNQMFEQAFAINKIKLFSDYLILKTSNKNMKKDFELFLNDKFKKLTQGEDIFDDVLLELALLNKKYTKEIESLNSSDCSMKNNLHQNLSTYLSIREQLQDSINDHLQDVLCEIEKPVNKKFKDTFPFITEKTDVNSIINNYIKIVNNINNLYKDGNLSDSEFDILITIAQLVSTNKNVVFNSGFSTILNSGDPNEVYSSFFDNNNFLGTNNFKFRYNNTHYNSKGDYIKSYKAAKESLLDNNSINNLISLSLIGSPNNPEQDYTSFIDPKNKFYYDHTYSIYCVDNKSKEVYITDPNKPEQSQILSYDDVIENIGFYYNQFLPYNKTKESIVRLD